MQLCSALLLMPASATLSTWVDWSSWASKGERWLCHNLSEPQSNNAWRCAVIHCVVTEIMALTSSLGCLIHKSGTFLSCLVLGFVFFGPSFPLWSRFESFQSNSIRAWFFFRSGFSPLVRVSFLALQSGPLWVSFSWTCFVFVVKALLLANDFF